MRDLWKYNETYDGPAVFMQNGKSCSQNNQKPAGETCIFEEELLANEVLDIITSHDQRNPLFLFYSMHLVHMPLQIPSDYEEKFSFISDRHRRLNHAMAYFLDQKVGDIVEALVKRNMWNNTLFVFHSDNGGEIMGAGICGGNNYPLTGGKFSNWEGGTRVNAFIAGGIIPEGKEEHGKISLTSLPGIGTPRMHFWLSKIPKMILLAQQTASHRFCECDRVFARQILQYRAIM